MQYQEEDDYTKGFSIDTWKKILMYARPHWKHLGIIAVAMVFTATIDVLFPMMTTYAIDNFITNQTLDGLTLFCALYAVLIIIQVCSIHTFIRTAGKVEVGTCYLIRKAAFRRLQELSFSFYDKTSVGFLMARMTSDCQRLGDTIGWTLVDLLWGIAYIILAAGAMLILNWKLALIALCVIPPLAIISIKFQSIILKLYRLVRKTNSRITGSFNEGIMGAKTTKTLVREAQNDKEFESLTGVMRKSSVQAALMSSIYMPIVMSLGSIATAAVLWQGGYNVHMEWMTLGMLTAFFSYTVQFFEPIREVARIFADLQSSQAAAERVISLLDTEPEIKDTEAVEKEFGDNFLPSRENWPEMKGDVIFNNVSFQYKGGEKVLDTFNLDVKSGQTIALVGETGAGKSTIVNLVCRFYEPTEGTIYIDGVDYKERSQLWLQSNLGYVLQQPHLFSGTIRENIRYGRLEATDDEVENAARLVNAEEFIHKLEKGYDTDVGEGGNRLSTGEKQLISFARAILADPRLFVLDEATSSVDTETEQKIQYAIHTVLEGRTSFIIAHRLSTIRSADLILVISEGKISERGTHRELIRQKGHYYDLYTNQFKEEREMEVLAEV